MDQTYKQERAKKYLDELNGMKALLDALKLNAAWAWEMATSTTPKPTSDAAILGTTIDHTNEWSRSDEKFAEESEKVRAKTEELTAAYFERIETINKLTDHTAAAILINHYVNGMTWEKTAEAVGYSESHVKVKGNDALMKLYDVLPSYAK